MPVSSAESEGAQPDLRYDKAMEFIAAAFEKKWFYGAALAIGVLYGLGGLVHIGNVLGFGEVKWSEAPLSWKLGDIGWGTLDAIAFIGIAVRAPIGIAAVSLAALSQVFLYGFFPDVFALTDAHRQALKSLVYFNAAILVALAVMLYLAGAKGGT